MATQPQVTEEVKTNEPEKGIDPKDGVEKFVYMYQPRDAEGQFIGKPYKYFYTDNQDLVKQITEGKEMGDRFIHEVKMGKRKVVGDPEVPKAEYVPVAPTTEEDTKRREQARKDLEAELGAPLDDVRSNLKKARDLEEYLICNTWAQQNETNGYYICRENAVKINKYLTDNKLRISADNLDLAFETLKDALVSKPQETIEVPADSTQQPPPTRAEVKPQSTGMIPGQFAGTRQPTRTEKQPLTAERFRQIQKMSRDQWQRLRRENPKDAEAYLLMKLPAQPQ